MAVRQRPRWAQKMVPYVPPSRKGHSSATEGFSVYEEASFYAPRQQTYSFLTFEAFEPIPAVEKASSASEDDDLLPELTGELVWKPRKR